MPLLSQQELLEPPPVRRLVVPRGHGAWYGVDPSTTRVSIAYCAIVDGEMRRGVRTAPFPKVEGPARLAAIYEETRASVLALLDKHWLWETSDPFPAPGVVLIEQPSGKVENPQLSYAVGVIQAAVYAGLAEALGRPVQVETTVSAHWKKVACGAGNIYKPKARSGQEYGVLTWARQNGYLGSSWDEADALAIAECARREIGLDER